MTRHSSIEEAQPEQDKGGESDTPESRRQIQRILEDAATAIEAAALVAAAAALRFPLIKKHLSAIVLALGAVALALEKSAQHYGRLADELELKMQGGSKSAAPPGARPNMGPPSPDSLLGPDTMIGASLAPVQGATRAGWLPEDVIARLEKTSQAGQGLADALAHIEQAGQRLGAVLVIDDARLNAVAESLDRAAQNVGGFGDSMTELKDMSERTFGRIKELLVDFTETGKFEWQDLARVALDSVRDILMNGTGSPGGGFGAVMEGIAAALGGLVGGPREHGGPVAPGRAFLVGEAGPELFVPPAVGEIVPAHALGGPAGGAPPAINITQNFDFKGASHEAVGLLRREANRIKHEIMADIMYSAQRGGAFARMPRV